MLPVHYGISKSSVRSVFGASRIAIGVDIGMRTILCAMTALAIVCGMGPLWPLAAQEPSIWPARSVKLLIPLGPGSGTDTIARLFADRLSKRWGKPVIVENRPGGDGIVAIKTFLSADDDHLLLFTATSVFTGHPYLYDKLPYDPRQLIPAARVADTPVVVAVPAALDLSSMKELVEMARKHPNSLNAASITGLLDLSFNGFLKAENLQIAKVPYRDTVQAANDLAENRIQILLTSITIVRAQVEAGKIRIIALTNGRPQPVAPGVPTVSEAGFPSLTTDGLVGFFTSKISGEEVRARIAADVQSVADAEPSLRDRLAAMGQVLNPGTPAEFTAAIEDQRMRAAEVARLLGIKPAEL
jgi:tripartite-type tricarboxylate transporter receptor subunit TctC